MSDKKWSTLVNSIFNQQLKVNDFVKQAWQQKDLQIEKAIINIIEKHLERSIHWLDIADIHLIVFTKECLENIAVLYKEKKVGEIIHFSRLDEFNIEVKYI